MMTSLPRGQGAQKDAPDAWEGAGPVARRRTRPSARALLAHSALSAWRLAPEPFANWTSNYWR